MSTTPQNPPVSLAVNTPRGSFISKLPDEMISKIFTYMLADHWCCVYQTIPPRLLLEDFPDQQVVAPLHLGAVCWRWRDIAWATPQLWTSISVDVGHDVLDDTHVALFKTYIARSGSLLLRLQLSVDDSEDVSTVALASQPPVRAMITAFLASSRRVVDLEVRLPEPVLQLVPGGPSDPQRPALKRLRITCVQEEFNGYFAMSNKQLQIGAMWDKLTHVVLRKMHFEHIDIAWTSLTHVDVYYFSAYGCVQLLRHAVNLTHLVVELNDDIFNALEPIGVVVHNRLRHMTVDVDFVERESVSWLFRQIGLPTLYELDLTLHDQFLDETMPKLFRHTLIPLTELTITEAWARYYEDCPSLIRVLKDIPSLVFLDISLEKRDQAYYDCLFNSLASFDTTEGYTLLPKLEQLRLNFGVEIIENHRMSWNLIPSVFAPFGLYDNIASDSEGLVRRRPLHTFHLNFGVWCVWKSPSVLLSHYIDRDVVTCLISLMDTGVTFRIGAHLNHESDPFYDVLQSSIKFHKLSKTDSALVDATGNPL